jgi:hypothetical protein
MRSLKLFFYFCLIFGWCSAAFAAEDAASATRPDTQPAAADDAADQSRPTLLTQYVQRGEQLALAETVEWFDVSDSRRWMAVQPARGALRGNVLLLADADTSANGWSYLANLREGLANHGWATRFTNLGEEDAQIEALVSAAIAQIPEGRLILVAAGHGCVRLVNLQGSAQLSSRSAGLVCLNVPVTGNQRAVSERLQAFAKLSLPALVLQEQPDGWPAYVVVAQDVEVHVMPPGSPLSYSVGGSVGAGVGDDGGVETSRVLRKIRGWLLRRYAKA